MASAMARAARLIAWTVALAPAAAMRVVWYCDRTSGQMVVDFNTTASARANCHNVGGAWYSVGGEVREYRAARAFGVACDGTLTFFEEADCVREIAAEYGGVFRDPARGRCTYSTEARVWSQLTDAPAAVCDECAGWYHEQYRQFLHQLGWGDACRAARLRETKAGASSHSLARAGHAA